MTDPPRRTRRPGPLPVLVSAIAAFLAVFVLLSLQLRAGNDPALGAAPVASATPRVRTVIVRKVHRIVIVTHIVSAPTAQPTAVPRAPSPVVASAPVQALPAPAPVTTRSS